MGAESKLREWMRRGPECRLSPADWMFVAAVQQYAAEGVGYGFMQQVAEWEWQAKSERDNLPGGSWGPEYYGRLVAELEQKNAALVKAAEAAEPILRAYIPPENFDGHAAKALEQVRAAIAKAKGEG